MFERSGGANMLRPFQLCSFVPPDVTRLLRVSDEFPRSAISGFAESRRALVHSTAVKCQELRCRCSDLDGRSVPVLRHSTQQTSRGQPLGLQPKCLQQLTEWPNFGSLLFIALPFLEPP